MKFREKIIPEKVQDEIDLKGFYLYRWLEIGDLSNVLKKRFLEILVKFGDKFGFVLLVIAILSVPFLDKAFLFYFLAYLFLFVFGVLFFYLLFLAINKGYFLIKNTYIIITLEYIIINSKILKLSDSHFINLELKKVENTFDTNLFSNSEKKYDFGKLKSILKSQYDNIYKKKIGSVVFLVLLLYIISSILIVFLYFIAIFFIFIFSIIIGFISKIILLKLGHEVTNINDSFIKIDKFGDKLEKQVIEIENLLEQAKDNDWKESLLLKINNNLEKINLFASKNIDLSIDLRKRIENSKYNNIYDFQIYNKWLKKEIYNPIFKIRELLITNKKIISDYLIQLNSLLKSTDIINKKPIETQFIILNLQNKTVGDKIKQLDIYLKKL